MRFFKPREYEHQEFKHQYTALQNGLPATSYYYTHKIVQVNKTWYNSILEFINPKCIEGERSPWWIWPSYFDFERNEFSLWMIGLHWIVRFSRRLWEYSRIYRISILEKLIQETNALAVERDRRNREYYD